jgi:thymidylate synthase
MNNLDARYQALIEDILHLGVEKKDRTGTGTISVFGRQIRHKMSEGFPLLTTKKMAWKSIVTELLWFLRGDTNIKYLVDNGCHIWDGDAYKRYADSHRIPGNPNGKTLLEQLDSIKPMEHSKESCIEAIKTDDEFAKKWGELGPIYGKQWRQWQGWMQYKKDDGTTGFGSLWYDQILRLIHQLKTEPDSRRLMVNAWNVAELDQMVLPPCHYGFQVYTRELSLDERAKQHPNPSMFYDIHGSLNIGDSIENSDITIKDREWLHGKFNEGGIPKRAISLMYNTRSQDVPLGTPFNIASYALLLMMIAKQVNMIPDELIANMGDCHVYLNQIEGAKEQLTRVPYELPTVKISDRVVNNISEYILDDITLENYQCHPSIKIPLSN